MVMERGAGVTIKDIDEDIWCHVENNDRDTSLHLAMREGQADVARMFIERGVDVTVQRTITGRPYYIQRQVHHISPGHFKRNM